MTRKWRTAILYAPIIIGWAFLVVWLSDVIDSERTDWGWIGLWVGALIAGAQVTYYVMARVIDRCFYRRPYDPQRWKPWPPYDD